MRGSPIPNLANALFQTACHLGRLPGSRKRRGAVSEDSLLERITAAAEERQPSSSPTDLSPNGPWTRLVGEPLRGSIEAVTIIADESFPRHASRPRPFRSHGEGRCSGL